MTEPKLQSLLNKVFEFEFSLCLCLTHTHTHARARARTRTHTHTHTFQALLSCTVDHFHMFVACIIMYSYGRPVLQAIRSQTFPPTADTTIEACVRPAFLGQVCTMYFIRQTPKRLFSISSHCTSVLVRWLHGYYQHVVTKEHSQGPPDTL